jgi:GAF domain-containing protein
VRTLDPDVELVEIDAFDSWLADIDNAGSAVFASQAALAAAQVAVACDSASVLQLDERGLRFVAASGPIAAQLVGRYIPADAGAAGFAVQHRQVMVLYEVGDDPRHFDAIDNETGYQTRNLCCVPVVHHDNVYGVIEVVNLPPGEGLSAESIHKLERVSSRLARRFAVGRPTRLSEATPAPDETGDPESFSDPVTLDDAAYEPISMEDVALALDDGEPSEPAPRR